MINQKVIDNFLSDEDYTTIRELMLDHLHFPWFYTPGVANKDDNNSIYFTHTFFEKELKLESMPFFQTLIPLLNKLEIPKDLWRVKGNLHPRGHNFIENKPHIDYIEPHQAAIYYVNTNNGHTRLHDGTKIDSVANRLLLFDGSKSHNSTNCTDEQVRVNINFNYV